MDISLCREMLYDHEAFWAAAAAVPFDEPLQRWLAALRLAFAQGNPKDATLICTAVRAYAAQTLPAHRHIAVAALYGACLPEVLERQRAAGIPEDILRDTFADFGIWARNYETLYGCLGIAELEWTPLPFCGKILRIGRLQYESIVNPFPYFVFQHKATGCLTALCSSDISVNEQGRICDTNGDCLPAAFKTSLTFSPSAVTGWAADNASAVLQAQPVSLPLAEYRLLLAPGMPVLNMHIPAGQSLSPQAVDASLLRAQAFFAPRDIAYQAAVCFSWLLDPSLALLCEPDSNIVQFMRRFSKMPVLSKASSAGKFLFSLDYSPDRLAEIAPKNALQRKVQAYLLQGNKLYDILGVIPF